MVVECVYPYPQGASVQFLPAVVCGMQSVPPFRRRGVPRGGIQWNFPEFLS